MSEPMTSAAVPAAPGTGVVIAESVDAALAALGSRPGAVVLAGGTDLMVGINMGHVRAAASVVCVNRIPELRSWRHDPTGRTLWIGAAVTWAELADAPLAGLVPALGQAARTVGSPQIRHAATIGGNVATSSPAGDGLPVLAALDAVIELVSPAGRRRVPFGEFATGPKRTVLQPGEMIEGVTVPVLDGYQGYSKVGVRNAMVISTAGACLAVDRPTQSVRIALGSVGPLILRAPEAEAFADGHVDWDAGTASDDVVEHFGRLTADASRPIDDHRSTAAYRRRAIEVLARRQLRRAFRHG